jgi:hypothetical protein
MLDKGIKTRIFASINCEGTGNVSFSFFHFFLLYPVRLKYILAKISKKERI